MSHKRIFFLILISILISQKIQPQNIQNIKIKAKWTTSIWSISEDLFNYIRAILPEGSTMLEFGSGWASGEFAKFYKIYSIEHDQKWVGKYHQNYIYAPLKNLWYDTDILEKELPKDYKLILVDGPPGNRSGLLNNLHLFNTDVIIIFDDINRELDYNLMLNVAKKLNRKYEIFSDNFNKKFGVLKP